MHIHILGICGTFMGGIACLARAKGYRVTGQDLNVYPPMSTQLENLKIELTEGFEAETLKQHQPDMVIIGNALKRGIPAVEYVLNAGLPFQSGPQWLSENLLQNRWVIAVAGTHGKTTTTSMVAWILEFAGFNPGFLIGGIPENFGVSARLGNEPFFVVEADEYDSAFFDKRSKFVHYRPKTCVLNNLEFDHADIFQDINEIKKQFHHLVRTVPSLGALIVPKNDPMLQDVLAMGYWSDVIYFGEQGVLKALLKSPDGSIFDVYHLDKYLGTIKWDLIGDHNVHNALAAIAATYHTGITPEVAIEALMQFKSVKRRMEIKGVMQGITIYDDFAHHPTAIRTSLKGLRAKIGSQPLIAVLDIRSNTMCMGTHQAELALALEEADEVYIYQSPKVKWDVKHHLASLKNVKIYLETEDLLEGLILNRKSGSHLLIMSNGGFDNLHQRLLGELEKEQIKA